MCGVHTKQEAPCFQPLVVHGRACRSVPDGAGGPLRALPCPPMLEKCRLPQRKRRRPAGKSRGTVSRRRSLRESGQSLRSMQRKTHSPEDSSTRYVAWLLVLATKIDEPLGQVASDWGRPVGRGHLRSIHPGLNRGSHGFSGPMMNFRSLLSHVDRKVQVVTHEVTKLLTK